MRSGSIGLVSCALLVSAAAPAVARPVAPAEGAGATTRSGVDPVDERALDVVFESHPHYRNLQSALDKMDAEIATSRLGPAHPRTVQLVRRRELFRQKLADVREQLRAAMANRGPGPGRPLVGRDPAWFIGEGLGMMVDRVPAAAAAGLDLPRGAGLLVHRVLPNTAAAAATILPGDVLVRLDGQLLVNNEQFEVVVESLGRDRDVEVQLFRDGSLLKRRVRKGAEGLRD